MLTFGIEYRCANLLLYFFKTRNYMVNWGLLNMCAYVMIIYKYKIKTFRCITILLHFANIHTNKSSVKEQCSKQA